MTVKSDFFNPNMGAAASSGVAAAASAASADELRTALSAMPKGTREALRAALADHDASAPPGLAIAEKAAIAQPACCQPGPATPEASYPLYAMPMATFMSLERLPPHNELREKGLVKALDFGGEHRNAALNFISHQWLGFSEADPQSVHLKTMQRVFNCAASGEKIFRSEEDWNAYSKGYTAENAVRQVEAMAAGMADDHVGYAEETFQSSVADGYVWMEYMPCSGDLAVYPGRGDGCLYVVRATESLGESLVSLCV